MGWKKSAATVRRKPVAYAAPAPAAAPLRERAPAGTGTVREAGSGADPGAGRVEETAPTSPPLQAPEQARSRRNRRALPVYDVSTGEDLETPVNLDNTLLQAMFPDLEIALGQVPAPPPRSSPEQVEAHWQAALEDLAQDLGDQEGLADQGNLALDIATGARKEGRFMYTDGRVGRQVANTLTTDPVPRRPQPSRLSSRRYWPSCRSLNPGPCVRS